MRATSVSRRHYKELHLEPEEGPHYNEDNYRSAASEIRNDFTKETSKQKEGFKSSDNHYFTRSKTPYNRCIANMESKGRGISNNYTKEITKRKEELNYTAYKRPDANMEGVRNNQDNYFYRSNQMSNNQNQKKMLTLIQSKQETELLSVISNDANLIIDVIQPLIILAPESKEMANFCFKILRYLVYSFGAAFVWHLTNYMHDFESLANGENEFEVKFLMIACVRTPYVDVNEKKAEKIFNLVRKLRFNPNDITYESYPETCFVQIFQLISELKIFEQKASTDLEYDTLRKRTQEIKEIINSPLTIEKLNIFEQLYLKSFSQTISEIENKYLNKKVNVSNLPNHNDNLSFAGSGMYNNYIKETLKPTKEYKIDKTKNRTTFIVKERLYEEEGLSIEYKDYRLPFTNEIKQKLRKTICAFLNSEGGRIYIGITDSKVVKGIQLTAKERDQLQREISQLTIDFYPNIRTEGLLETVFIPIVNQERTVIPGLFIVKVIIKQGDPSKLYSTSIHDNDCYQRVGSEVVHLNTAQVRDKILEREKLKVQEAMKIKKKESKDPSPDRIEDIPDQQVFPQRTQQIFSQPVQQKLIEVKIKGPMVNITNPELNAIVLKNGFNSFVSCNVIRGKDHAFLKFENNQEATKFIDKKE